MLALRVLRAVQGQIHEMGGVVSTEHCSIDLAIMSLHFGLCPVRTFDLDARVRFMS